MNGRSERFWRAVDDVAAAVESLEVNQVIDAVDDFDAVTAIDAVRNAIEGYDLSAEETAILEKAIRMIEAGSHD